MKQKLNWEKLIELVKKVTKEEGLFLDGYYYCSIPTVCMELNNCWCALFFVTQQKHLDYEGIAINCYYSALKYLNMRVKKCVRKSKEMELLQESKYHNLSTYIKLKVIK